MCNNAVIPFFAGGSDNISLPSGCDNFITHGNFGCFVNKLNNCHHGDDNVVWRIYRTNFKLRISL